MPDYWLKFLGGARYMHKYISLAPLWHGTTSAGRRRWLRRLRLRRCRRRRCGGRCGDD